MIRIWTYLDLALIYCNLCNKLLKTCTYTLTMPSLFSPYIEITPPNVIRIQPKANSIECSLEHTPNMECYSRHTFQYHVVWYPVINGVPDVTQLQNGTFPSSDPVVIDGLMSDTEYKVNITAEYAGNEDVVSDPLSLGFTTVSEFCLIYLALHCSCLAAPVINNQIYMLSRIIMIVCCIDIRTYTSRFSAIGIPIAYISSADPVCFDRQVQLTCHHHDINDTTSSGPIFNQTSPVVWMKDGERIDLPDTYHLVVSQNNTETVVSVTTRKSVFLNGEVNYSCAVVYADGSMEESEPVTVRVRGEYIVITYHPILSSLCNILYMYLQSLPFLQPHSHLSLLIQVSP